ncbi:MAG: hypothetical protein AB7G39_00810 [Alphaproteobacteria bacterium]
MPYVARNPQGRIVGVSDRPTRLAREMLPINHPEVQAFLRSAPPPGGGQLGGGQPGAPGARGGIGANEARSRLSQSDTEMARITEDLIDLLIAKNLINFTDFPSEAQKKLISRRALRRNLSTLSNLVSDQDDIL